MSRLRRIADRDRIFFVTTNLAPRVCAFSSAERDLVLRHLSRRHTQSDFLLFGYVVMPTHLHLLLMPLGRGLAAAMHALKRLTAEDLRRTPRGWWANLAGTLFRFRSPPRTRFLGQAGVHPPKSRDVGFGEERRSMALVERSAICKIGPGSGRHRYRQPSGRPRCLSFPLVAQVADAGVASET
jgi:hypothetical protein